jgi:DNA-binding CsgD family transcriptional regulator
MAGTLGSNGTTTVVDDDPLLTARERAVLAASATGLVVADVAELLALSPADVRRVLVTAMTKLRARSKLEAVVIALRTGLIALPQDLDVSDNQSAASSHAGHLARTSIGWLPTVMC